MRIVSLAPSNTEIIFSLEAEDKIEATTSLCDHPEKALEKPSVGGWSHNLKVEKVKELEPHIALASDDLQNQIVSRLKDNGVQVVQFKPHTLDDVFNSIEKIGALVGRRLKAQKKVNRMKEKLEQLELEGKRIYCEEWMEPPMASGNWVPDLVERMNGEYMIRSGQRSREVSLSEIKEFDPEHIFLNVCGAGRNVNTTRINERNDWENITAVENGNIHTVDDALLNRPGPRLVKGAERLYRAVRSTE